MRFYWIWKTSRLLAFILVSLSLEASATSYPYEVIKERLEYTFYSKNTKYDTYNPATTLTIDCTRHIKILSKEGIDLMSTYTIPEAIDPIYYDIISEARQSPFYLENYTVVEASAFYNSGGAIEEVTFEPSEIPVFLDDKLLKATSTIYEVKFDALQIGSIIKIKYKLSVPIGDNHRELGSFRVFFHSEVPKTNYSLKINSAEDAFVLFNYVNEAEPQQSFKREVITDKWSFDTLAPALAESHAHPYKELPHIEVMTRIDNLDGFFRAQFSGSRAKNTRFRKMQSNKTSIDVGSTYSNFKKLNKYISTFKELNLPDSAQLLATVAADLAEFKYDIDREYFGGEQYFEPQFGNDLEAKKLRESNKYELYCAVLDGLGFRYFILTPMDKRIGQFSNYYARPNYSSENMIAVLVPPSSIYYLLPKSIESGYYLEEMPYYFEGSQASVNYTGVPLYKYEEWEQLISVKKMGWSKNRPLMQLASSSAKDNKKSCAMQATVNLTDKKLHCQGSLKISGQFSTLLRSSYTTNERMAFVGKQYTQKVHEDIAGAQIIEEVVSERSKRFPFPHTIQFQFQSDSIIRDNGDFLEIDLSNFVKHINYQVDTVNRSLDYYPDFKLTDNFTLQINFSEPIELIQEFDPIQLKNSYGMYAQLVQSDTQTVQIVSRLIIDSDLVAAERIADVKAINDAIEDTEALVLKVRRK